MLGLMMKAVALLGIPLVVKGAFPPRRHHMHSLPPLSHIAANLTKQGTFQQLLDHERPELGTFSQRFWASNEYVRDKSRSFPVVLMLPGEGPADGGDKLLSNNSLWGTFAQATGAAMVVLEHRYYGGSSPFDTLTVDHLQYLTLRNSIADLVHFAQNVTLPFDPAGQSRAPHAPWILAGCSYAGALSAWTASTAPGTFQAYYAGSAPVEAIWNFWRYFEPIRAGMALNCSRDVESVVDYVDSVLAHGDPRKKAALKDQFGLTALEHDDDVASALQLPIWTWQDNKFFTGYSQFYQFCDYVENVQNGSSNGRVPDARGAGVEKALDGFAKWMKEAYLPGFCANYWGTTVDTHDISCLENHNPNNSLYTNLSVDNGWNRQWNWMLCNEPFGWWQTTAPEPLTNLISRLVTPEYWQLACDLGFRSNATSGAAGPHFTTSTGAVNAFTGGWSAGWGRRLAYPRPHDAQRPRVVFVNGEFDPWLPATVSSEERPGGPLVSSDDQPVFVVPGGSHCAGLVVQDALANEGVAHLWNKTTAIMKEWADEFYAARVR